MTEDRPTLPGAALRRAAVAILPVVAASVVGQIATYPNLRPWYQSLAKPGFNPPNWLFAPTWTALYLLMAYAARRVLRLSPSRPGRREALACFFLQLGLNAAWPWAFFAMHSPLAGLLDIVLQWLMILATIGRFHRLDKAAAWCLVPLAAWVAFATALNLAIWHLNG